MAVSKAECKRVALETFIRIAKTDTAEAIPAAYALMRYAVPDWDGSFYPTLPIATPSDSLADDGGVEV